MIDLCHYAVSVGEKFGVDEIEAFWVKNVTTSIRAQLGEINEASMVRNEGIRIRAIRDKALGSVFTYGIDKEGVRTAVEKALHAAQASKKDKNWDSLPSAGTYPQVSIWNSSLEEVSSESLMEPIIHLLQLLPEDIAVHLAFNRVELSRRACVNSNGIEHADKGALGLFGMMVVGKVEDGVTPGFEEFSYLREYNPDPQKTAESLIENVNLFRKPEAASAGKSFIIFSPEALESLLFYTLFKALSGENVAREKSLLGSRGGEKVASSQLTLHDNGIIPQGTRSGEMDDEGVPCQNTLLIEDGILQGFIWNDYWAKRMNVFSTGNGYYNDQADEMTLEQSTMVIREGDYTRAELFDIKDGYYVLGLQGAHGSNPESGDFSVACAPALRIRNGEISGGVTGMMLPDNIFSILKKIDAIGSERKVCTHTIMPHVRFTDVNVATK
jgi:PmbA protein